MPIIGAVLTLTSQEEPRQAALEFLNAHPAIEVGTPGALGFPVVLDCASRAEERAIWDQLDALPGVTFASVVYNDFSDIVDRKDCQNEPS